jgi:hypothetical protein
MLNFFIPNSRERLEFSISPSASSILRAAVAPNLSHGLVDSLHSIHSKEDKVRQILLTPKIEGVKRQSFFDIF